MQVVQLLNKTRYNCDDAILRNPLLPAAWLVNLSYDPFDIFFTCRYFYKLSDLVCRYSPQLGQ